MVLLHDPQVVLEYGTDVFVSVFPAPVQVGPVDGLQVAVAVKIEIQIIMGEFVCVTFLFLHVNFFSTSVDRATTEGVSGGGGSLRETHATLIPTRDENFSPCLHKPLLWRYAFTFILVKRNV